MKVKKKKVLISAYSCEPEVGSEHEIGWQWAINLANKGFQTDVITRYSNKTKIYNYFKKNKIKSNLNFYFYDLPKWILVLIKGKKNPNSYFYFIIWQMLITIKFYNRIKNTHYDFIHHVTFVSARIPSFLGLLNKNFIFGPVAGGEIIPKRLRLNFSKRENIFEIIRNISNKFIYFSPLMNLTFATSKKIYVTSLKTKILIPKIYHYKTSVLFSLGVCKKDISKKYIKKYKKKLTICYVGRLISLKGVHILLKAIYCTLKKEKDIYFNIYGDGTLKKTISNFIIKNNFSKNVKIFPSMEKKKLNNIYRKNDILVMPALRDSGGMVVLEAMSNYLPCIVLNLGGPGRMVNNLNGFKINTHNKTVDVIANDIAKTIFKIYINRKILRSKREYLIKDILKYDWITKIKKVYKL